MTDIKRNLYITVAYKLYTKSDNENRELVEEATREQPFQFVSGLGMTLDDFEAQITGLNADEKFSFELTPAQAYGDFEQERIINVPRSTFEIDGRLDKEYIYEGAVVPLQNADGARFNGQGSDARPQPPSGRQDAHLRRRSGNHTRSLKGGNQRYAEDDYWRRRMQLRLRMRRLRRLRRRTSSRARRPLRLRTLPLIANNENYNDA